MVLESTTATKSKSEKLTQAKHMSLDKTSSNMNWFWSISPWFILRFPRPVRKTSKLFWTRSRKTASSKSLFTKQWSSAHPLLNPLTNNKMPSSHSTHSFKPSQSSSTQSTILSIPPNNKPSLKPNSSVNSNFLSLWKGSYNNLTTTLDTDFGGILFTSLWTVRETARMYTWKVLLLFSPPETLKKGKLWLLTTWLMLRLLYVPKLCK